MTSPPPPAANPPSGADAVPGWLRTAGAAAWRLLAVAAVIVAALYLLSILRVIVLPIIIAILATTLLLPPVRALRNRGLPPAAAVAIVMVGSVLVLAGLVAAIAPSIGNQASELGTGVQDGVRKVGDVLANRPFNLSEQEIRTRIDEGIARLRENSGPLTKGVQTGAILLGEIVTGLIITVLLTFFFLKDGAVMWRWITDFAGPRRRATWDEVGVRIFTALGGYVRGIALVGLVDAVLIGIALLVLGVPLVLPLMVLTFIGAFLPLIGAFLAGLASVLIALVSQGVFVALLVLGAVILVQQIEGHLLYPLLMGRTVHLHPAVIVTALAIGGILAGIIGVFLAVPVAGVISVLLSYARREPPPESPVTDDPDADRVGARASFDRGPAGNGSPMLDERRAAELRGQTVLDTGGEAVGTIDDVFLFPADDRPAIAAVDTGGQRVLVPLDRADFAEGRVTVRYEAEQIRGAPAPDAEQLDAARVYAHYGITDADLRDDSGFPVTAGEDARAQGSTRAPGGGEGRLPDGGTGHP